MINTYQSPKTTLAEDEVFVFGSNRDGGFHGSGSAGFASFGEFGNVWRKHDYASKPNGWKGKWNVKGISEGPMLGTEGKSYAIPTVTRAGAKRSIRNFARINRRHLFGGIAVEIPLNTLRHKEF